MAQYGYGMPTYPVSLAYNFFTFYNTAFNFSQCIKRSIRFNDRGLPSVDLLGHESSTLVGFAVNEYGGGETLP